MKLFSNLAENILNNRRHPWKVFCLDPYSNRFLQDLATLLKQDEKGSSATLHIVAEAIGDYFVQKDYGKPYNGLDDLQKEIIDVKIKLKTKPDRYDASKEVLTFTAA